jgi:hypothetical protein
MDDTPKCEKCGLEITTGMMAALCPQARNCCMWPRSDGTPELDGAELLFAKLWMDKACEQIGLQIDERKRLERELAEATSRISDERKARELADEEIANLRNDLDRHIAIATAEASYAEVAAREVEFLCRQLEILGYHKGAAISRDRVANAKRPLPEAPK